MCEVLNWQSINVDGRQTTTGWESLSVTQWYATCLSEGENTSEKSFVSDGVHSRHNEFQRLSALKDHESSECRDTGIKEMKHEEAVAAGESLPPKHIVHEVPTDSAIASGMQKMSEKERAGIMKLMDIS